MKRKPEPTLFNLDAPGLDDEGAYAYARRTDPETSHAAASSLRPDRIATLRSEVLCVFVAIGPMDDGALVGILHPRGWSPSGIRTRRAELVESGLVEDSGIRQKLLSGRYAIVWRAKA